MKPPIFVKFADDAELYMFASVVAVEEYFEPIDVQSEESVAYDSEGRLLRLVVTEPPHRGRVVFGVSVIETYGAWKLQPAEDHATHLDALHNELIHFLIAMRQPEGWARNAPLEELIAVMNVWESRK